MEKILSICVPTYNMEALLSRCLDSFIMNKEYMDQLEVIVVNDGSKDNSSTIAHEYVKKYPNTYVVIDKNNGNYGSCVNAALKIATGKYFRICDADDCFYRDNLPGYLSILNNSESDLIFTPYDIYSFDNILQRGMQIYTVEDGQVFDICDIDAQYLNSNYYRAMHCIAILTKILQKNRYYQTEGISYTDTEFVFYSILYADTFAFYSRPIYKYYLGRDGQTMSIESQIRSNMHFYENAKVMIDTYKTLPQTLPESKRLLLFSCIKSCMSYFCNIILGYIKHPTKQLNLVRNLLTEANNCELACPLDEALASDLLFKLWRKYHIPARAIYSLMRFNVFLRKYNIRKSRNT